MPTEPLRLFWYRKVQNFGDAISPYVTRYVSRRAVVWVPRAEAELFGIGSLMEMVANGHQMPRPDGVRPWVWGTGCMTRTLPRFQDNVRFALVRGPVSAEILGLDADGHGDPGLLIADALDDWPERGDRIGLIPHFSKIGDPGWAGLLADHPALTLIDVTDPDPLKVARRIASCAHVISSSLHGLITADAYGIPNTWLDPAGNHVAPQLKFRDYARSVGRRLFDPLPIREIPVALSRGLPDEVDYLDGILASKSALLDSFPNALKSRPKMQGAA